MYVAHASHFYEHTYVQSEKNNAAEQKSFKLPRVVLTNSFMCKQSEPVKCIYSQTHHKNDLNYVYKLKKLFICNFHPDTKGFLGLQ
jgi:hypothetical protein